MLVRSVPEYIYKTEIRKDLTSLKNVHLNFHLLLRVRKYEKKLLCLGQEFLPQCYKRKVKCVRYKLYLFLIITFLWQLYIEDIFDASCIFCYYYFSLVIVHRGGMHIRLSAVLWLKTWVLLIGIEIVRKPLLRHLVFNFLASVTFWQEIRIDRINFRSMQGTHILIYKIWSSVKCLAFAVLNRSLDVVA